MGRIHGSIEFNGVALTTSNGGSGDLSRPKNYPPTYSGNFSLWSSFAITDAGGSISQWDEHADVRGH